MIINFYNKKVLFLNKKLITLNTMIKSIHLFSFSLIYLIFASNIKFSKDKYKIYQCLSGGFYLHSKVFVNIHEEFKFALQSDKFSYYQWYLTNTMELKKGGYLLPLNLNEKNGSNDYISNPVEHKDWKGMTLFKFKALKKGNVKTLFRHSDKEGKYNKLYYVEVIIK